MSQILPKWDPRNARARDEDEPDLTDDEQEQVPFKPPRQIAQARDGFRVLTKGRREEPLPRPRRRRRGQPAVAGPIIAHISGIVKTPRRKATRAGAGIFLGDHHDGNKSMRIPPHWGQNARTAEVAAALLILRETPEEAEIVLTTSNPFIRNAMNKHLQKWEDEDWTGVKDAKPLQCLAAELKRRTGLTSFVVVEGSRELSQAKRLATEACHSNQVTEIPLRLPEGYELPGVKLADTKQRTFYRAIKARKNGKRKPRKATEKRVNEVTNDILRDYGRAVDPETLWLTARTKDMSYRARTFFWRHIHDSFRLGRQWDDIPNWEHCGKCPTCDDAEESIAHILLECEEPGQTEIWAEAKRMWSRTGQPWPITTVGAIFGCATATFTNKNGKTADGNARLFRILVSESAFLIWKLRNERRMDANVDTHAKQAVLNRWYAAINSRLEIDRTLANRPARSALTSLNPVLVLQTWSPIISNQNILPENWLKEPRVLVGPAQRHRPNGRNR
ncbi:hypothetical protein C8F01DRAFT_998180 [Mycena amicta]|nr:hypothetical protein C8F01DRAFT_998180 [Mycena amicta]